MSAVAVLIALLIIHGMLGWHKGDIVAVPGEAKVVETLHGLNVQRVDYRFSHGATVTWMTAPTLVPGSKQRSRGAAMPEIALS